jgi:hypothetical protein
LNAQTYRINAIVNNRTSTGYLNSTNYATIGKLVLEQCDGIDKVMDGFITNPALCKPDLSPLLCGASNASSASVNSSTCLNQAQVDTMYAIWGNFTAQTDAGLPKGSFIFPGFEPGAEGSPAFSVNGVPYGPGPDYYEYQVLNKTDPKVTFSGDETELERLLKVALETDPGQTNAADPEIGDFLAHGKLLTYVGEADTLIPTHSSHDYYEDVRTALGHPKNLSDSYRFFTGKQANALRPSLDVLCPDALTHLYPPKCRAWVTAVGDRVPSTLEDRANVKTLSAAVRRRPFSTSSTTWSSRSSTGSRRATRPTRSSLPSIRTTTRLKALRSPVLCARESAFCVASLTLDFWSR